MFYHPWFLLLLPLVPIVGWRLWSAGRETAIHFSSAAADWDVRPSWRQRILWLPSALLLTALTLMILAMARPRHGREQTIIDSEGIAIEMVVDRSGSMRALDFKIDGQHVDRLAAIKNVASKFVTGDTDGEGKGDGTLPGRVTDLIGLISFAGFADAITPPTLDHGFLVAQLENVRIVDAMREGRGEDGTAIGDAISLAVDKLSTLDARQAEKVKSKVIILLTDGENTAGEIEPAEAAELAAALGIKVYTIGVGTKGRAPFAVRTRSGRVAIQYDIVNIDEETLQAIADATSGKYFRATDTESLEAIYHEIDQLEKTKVESQQFVDYRELAVQTARIGGFRVPALLLIAMLALSARSVLQLTVLRQLT
jgi:Ca-activated chloride channel family protein